MKPFAHDCVAPNRPLRHKGSRLRWPRPQKTMNALALLLTLTLLGTMTPTLLAAARDADWKKVEEAIGKGLPKTAIEALEPIIAGALADQAYGEAAKAIARKIVLEGNVQGNKPEEKITRLEQEVAKAPKELAPLLETILANWYWHYFQNNRWRFLQRTATSQAPGKDFTAWDLPRLFAEIDAHFTRALSAADTLKQTPISRFDDLLEKGTLPDTYRPTLFDFIAHEALRFYTSAEQAAAKPQDAFELFADKPVYGIVPVFGTMDEFCAGKIERHADESSVEKAFFLFRDLLTFHRHDQDPSALADADLARLGWAYNTAFGEDKTARYKTALELFADTWAGHEISARALHQWARVLQGEGDLVQARALARRGENAFGNSAGGRLCHNLIAEIESKSASITTERVWHCPTNSQPAALRRAPGAPDGPDVCPTITVRYRNLDKVYFRAVAWDWNAFLDKRHRRPEFLDERERRELLAKAPILEWSADLPPTPDFQERVEELPAPVALKPGFYFLIASHDEHFTDTDNQVSFTDVWVSELALVVRPHDLEIEGFVLAADSGEPIPGAEVMAWHLDNNGDRRPNGPATRTDENGFFSIAGTENRGSLLRVQARVGEVQQELGSMQEYWSHRANPLEPYSQTLFFTDRALYRPGQIVQYKGICLRVDAAQDNYAVLAGQKVSVVFSDPNGKEIARAEHQCNDYGSFSGSFTAPRDRLPGRMQISVASGPSGSASCNVEEYKRPKFQVTLDAPKSAARLNGTVSLQGKAESYNGAAVDGALVKYRVVREVRWPYWFGWYSWRAPRAQGSQEIAHGTAQTDQDGRFTIEFSAKPDPAVSERDEVSFSFTIHADVTDTAGETRSAQRGVNVGFTALQAALSAEDWLTDDQPIVLRIRTTTLDGEPQTAEGKVKIYRLKEPAQVQRAPLTGRNDYRNNDGPAGGAGAPGADWSNPNHWDLDSVAAEQGFSTDAEGNAKLEWRLGAGVYRAWLETEDRFSRKVTARLPLQVLRPAATKLAIKIPHLLAAPRWSLQPGQEFMALWGSGYDSGRAFIELEHRQQIVERYWTRPGQTQQQIRRPITEAMRGGFTLHVTQVRQNRAYLTSRHVDVPWSNKNLQLKWEHFTSKLSPNQKETWTAVISQPRQDDFHQHGRDDFHVVPDPPPGSLEKTIAEMVATLYDESLDQYLSHDWMQRFGFFRQDYSSRSADFANVVKGFQLLQGHWRQNALAVDLRYRQFPPDLVANLWGYQFSPRMRGGVVNRAAAGSSELSLGAPMAAAFAPAEALGDRQNGDLDKRAEAATKAPTAGARSQAGDTIAQGPDLSHVSARKNLNETAFFFPQLISDRDGLVKLQFTMPEALTQWRFLGFAHDQQLRSGYLEGHAFTAKDLMVQPNPPRFLREDDRLEFTVKVSNQTAVRQRGKVRLTFHDAQSEQNVDSLLGNATPEISFDLPAKESRSYSWSIKVPDGAPFLVYKAVGSTGRVSDGEEGFLPVLPRRILVTESMPLPVRGRANGPVSKRFEFAKLLHSGESSSLAHQSLTVQMVSNPSWYAVMALPYLMEYPHECTEQTFNRFYANALARFLANSDPRIRRVFDQWKDSAALDSPLEKNQDLKSVLIEETPWLRQANRESQARHNVGILFAANRLDQETERTLQKLAAMQLPDGSWPWFPGGRGNDYITLYITTGFGRLRHLGVDLNVEAALRSLHRLDAWMDERYRQILKGPKPEDYVPSATDALYLYGRSFFLKDQAIAPPHRKAVDFFLAQSRAHWLKLANRQSQGHLAIALKRFNSSSARNDSTPRDIMKSIQERSVTDEELGMFWRETELSWWWYRAPIETQALMIEAFDEVMGDARAVEECRVWLLKQKQTQDWKTTKATADAVYALLLRGRDLLASDALVEISLGGSQIRNLKSEIRNPVEAGTGFYEKRFPAPEIKPVLGEISVKKVDPGIAWGSVHWQYFEDMSKVTPHQGTPLKLKKSLHTKVNTKQGQRLEPVQGPVRVGDELVVRLELRVDRDMEYVHLKDQRGSGTEPVNILSQYKEQDGLAYYESTRDTASHFFIDYLPKGTYVFEYSTRLQHRGQYHSGIAEIQCLYAPEFNSHSESLLLIVK